MVWAAIGGCKRGCSGGHACHVLRCVATIVLQTGHCHLPTVLQMCHCHFTTVLQIGHCHLPTVLQMYPCHLTIMVQIGHCHFTTVVQIGHCHFNIVYTLVYIIVLTHSHNVCVAHIGINNNVIVCVRCTHQYRIPLWCWLKWRACWGRGGSTSSLTTSPRTQVFYISIIFMSYQV
jgi:hypothetical protein